jgi:hypothetical protein
MKYYEFTQNNSGGRFYTDDKLCHRLIIQAIDENEAISKAESLGCYWNGVSKGYDCDCCGDRWYRCSRELNIEKYNESGYPITEYSTNIEAVREKYNGFSFTKEPEVIIKKHGNNVEAAIRLENIEQYAELMAKLYGGWTEPDTRIFYHNDIVAEFI